MKTSPATPLEVIEADLLFHFLVVALDPPAKLCQPNELLQRDASGERREPVLGGLRLLGRPLVQKPLLVAGRFPLTVIVGAPNANATK
jgi:hypothetical protein